MIYFDDQLFQTVENNLQTDNDVLLRSTRNHQLTFNQRQIACPIRSHHIILRMNGVITIKPSNQV